MKRIASTYWERYPKQVNAQQIVLRAIRGGSLVRPGTCELCDKKPKGMTVRPWKLGQAPHIRSGIFAHHWRGYDSLDAILDVWWICHHCNRRLCGDEYHNGSVTKEEARAYIASLN